MARLFVPKFLATLCTLVASCLLAHGEDEASPKEPTFKLPDRSLYQKGRYVFEQNCMVCHGERGNGKGEMAAQLSPKPRDFTSGLFKYRSTPWGKLPTNEDLLHTIREGRTNTAMGIFSHLREDELRAVVEYIKFLSRKWRKAENYAEAIPLPDPPDWFSDLQQLERRAKAGSKTFSTNCATCHGADGDGRGPAAAALKDAAGDPIIPADLRQERLRSGNELSDIYRVLLTGLNGTPMVSFAETLTDQQRWEVVAYILQLRLKHSASAAQ
ncbi:MAG: cytochrome c [Verrucomicrobiaceae bacterium]|nr:MAG: cytochrome c [Verrucomicrobiaceae bacterium]